MTLQSRPSVSRFGVVVVECVAVIALVTATVAALDTVAPVTGLGVLYLLGVFFIAVRQGEIAALATAFFSVVALNFFFIEPRYRLTIAESENVVALLVFLVAAVVVGRLAAAGRQRAREAEQRARIAVTREREADMLAAASSAVLAGSTLESQLKKMSSSVGASAQASRARIELSSAPSPARGEFALRLPTKLRPAWLYVDGGVEWDRSDFERVAQPLAQLVDLALERERVDRQLEETEAARRADVAKSAVLHAVSHDLRSPLTSITTAVSGLKNSALSESDRSDLVSVIEVESQRLARVVDDLLDLSRIQAGAVDPRRDWCDLRDMISGAISEVAEDHPVEMQLPADLPLIRADAAQLERVFANLISNAVKFSPPGAPVRISGAVTARAVTVRVTDRGPGIPLGQRAHVFEPFFRGRKAERGSGLGLAISKGFVEANGGSIFLQADAPDGTAFAVSLPLVRQPAPVP